MRAIVIEKFGGPECLVYKLGGRGGEQEKSARRGQQHHPRFSGDAAPRRPRLSGWLAGLDPIRDFNPLLQMASGVYLTFFGSFVFGTPGFPLSDVPLQTQNRRRQAASRQSRRVCSASMRYARHIA